MFDILQNSSVFLLEIMTFVSSADIMFSYRVLVFIVGGRSFMYIKKVLSAATGT
jgi:hypothetical protein